MWKAFKIYINSNEFQIHWKPVLFNNVTSQNMMHYIIYITIQTPYLTPGVSVFHPFIIESHLCQSVNSKELIFSILAVVQYLYNIYKIIMPVWKTISSFLDIILCKI